MNREAAKIAQTIDDEFFSLPMSKRPDRGSVLMFVERRFASRMKEGVVTTALSILEELKIADHAYDKHARNHKPETDAYDNRLRNV